MGAIEAARRDLAAQRPWKARQRLGSYLTGRPADQPARELLGEVELAMRNVPAAGAAWFLTERDDETARAAIAVLRAEHGSARALAAALRVRAPVAAWPPGVQERLRELQTAVAAESGARWEPGGSPAFADPAGAAARARPSGLAASAFDAAAGALAGWLERRRRR